MVDVRKDRLRPRAVEEGTLLEGHRYHHQLDQVTIDRARQLAGLKGYVTNLLASWMDGAAVIAAYHDL